MNESMNWGSEIWSTLRDFGSTAVNNMTGGNNQPTQQQQVQAPAQSQGPNWTTIAMIVVGGIAAIFLLRTATK